MPPSRLPDLTRLSSAVMAKCDQTPVVSVHKKSRTEIETMQYEMWPLKVGSYFVADWTSKPEFDNKAIGARCLLTAASTFYILNMMDNASPRIQATLKAMPPKSLQNLWYLSKGQAVAYFFKDVDTLLQVPVQVRPELASDAAAVGVKIETLKSSDSLDEQATIINAFVKEKTEGMIEQLVTGRDLKASSSVMVAAEFIKRHWVTRFAEYATAENQTFHCLDGSKGTCHLMNFKDNCELLPYIKLKAGELVLLPTSEKKGGKRDTAYMAMFLPNTDGDPTKSNVDDLYEGSKEIANRMSDIIGLVHDARHWTMVNLQMPRMDAKTEDPIDVTNLLVTHGFEDIFRNNSIKYGLATQDENGELVDLPQQASSAIMTTTVTVHERGFAAAAAVAIVCYRSCGGDKEASVVMKLDRPFAMHILKLPTAPGIDSESNLDKTPPQFLYSMNVTSDAVLKDAKSAKELFPGKEE